jgi:F0F1-type ATP synthase membrane subunit c/vacuolar-type H+-ATPase subunit K
MRKWTIALTFGIAGLVAGMLLSNQLSAAATSYGEDRAQIEDLQARYLFALDFHDPQL